MKKHHRNYIRDPDECINQLPTIPLFSGTDPNPKDSMV